MIYSYDKIYLERGRITLGRMLDFAVYDLGFTLDVFWEKFLASYIVKKFEIGDFSVLVGKSGVEIAFEITDDIHRKIKPKYTENRSVEYWVGWAIAYFQWQTSMPFKMITDVIPIGEIAQMYFPYHEMDIRQFCDKLIELYRKRKKETNLKIKRKKVGLSQKELSEQSAVPLRTLQQYEQGQKNINNARAEYVLSLARALYCEATELLEY